MVFISLVAGNLFNLFNLFMISALQTLIQIIQRLIAWIGYGVAWLTLGMVLVLFTVVVLRYFFQTGAIALQESITYMHALVFMLGAAYTLQQDGHVRVDIYYQHWSPTTKAWINNFGIVFFLWPVCFSIAALSWQYVSNAWAIHEASREAGGLPGVFLLKSVILVLPGLLALQGLAQFLQNLLQILGYLPPTETSSSSATAPSMN